ncbi:MAG TPA: hypothetical protein VLG14_17185 [Sphingomonas sp.]|nr:hypothetical protein [Sphingomonas sp.]
MSMMEQIGTASDRVMSALAAGLELEFGRGAGDALARRFLAAEEAEFRWDARIEERWLGFYPCPIEEDLELDRVACLGQFDGRWFMSVMLVDGEGNAQGMLGCRTFGRAAEARRALADAR